MKKKLLFIFIILLWGSLIFTMSNMNSKESGTMSKNLITNTLQHIPLVNTNNIKDITKKIHKPVRKLAHFTEYFVLTTLLILVLKYYRVDNTKIIIIALSICFLYACTDEIHQLFVSGREGKFTDVLIDTLGGTFACITYIHINKIKNKTLN